MDIETEDSVPVSQRRYNLHLKCKALVKKELKTQEKAGINVHSVSSLESPIVVTPK